MSQPAQTTARLLETSLRDALAASPLLRDSVASGVLSLYVQNEKLPDDPDAAKLPSVTLTGEVKEWNLSMRYQGRYAEDCSLKVHCRVAVNKLESAREIEQLAANVQTSIETATTIVGWVFLRINLAGDERGFDKGARVLTSIYEVTAAPL